MSAEDTRGLREWVCAWREIAPVIDSIGAGEAVVWRKIVVDTDISKILTDALQWIAVRDGDSAAEVWTFCPAIEAEPLIW